MHDFPLFIGTSKHENNVAIGENVNLEWKEKPEGSILPDTFYKK